MSLSIPYVNPDSGKKHQSITIAGVCSMKAGLSALTYRVEKEENPLYQVYIPYYSKYTYTSVI